MKIVLCDDEPMIRLGLRSMLEELFPGAHEYTEAASGDELVALAREKPDLAFVDIQMPGTDGLAAIEAAKEISPGTRWLILTGHSEFSYAQSGLRLGVADYLLKPVGRGQLRRVMEAEGARHERQAAAEMEARNRDLHLRMTKLFRRWQSLGEMPAPEEPPQLYTLCLLYLDHHDSGVRIRQLGAVEKTVEKCLAGAACPCTLFYLSDSELCLILQGEGGGLAAAMEETVHAQHTVTAVWCTDICGAHLLPQAAGRIMDGALLRPVWCFGRSVGLDALEKLRCRGELARLAQALDAVCMAFQARDDMGYRQAVEAFANLPADVCICGDNKALAAYLQAVLGLDFAGGTQQELVTALAGHASRMYTPEAKRQSGDIVAQIKEYVKQHYMEDIGVNSIADTLDITPNYLSRIFHQRAGVRFIDYLSETRVSAAKRLLAEDKGITIKETAERVGYFSQRHFTKVFVKLAGVTPSEYQKTQANRPGPGMEKPRTI